jgi:hypothetical protein
VSGVRLEAAVRRLVDRRVSAEVIEEQVWHDLARDVGRAVRRSAGASSKRVAGAFDVLQDAIAEARAAGVSRPDVLVGVHEQLLRSQRGERRRRGAFYTPTDIADRLAEFTLDPLLEVWTSADKPLLVLDPACGAGVFVRAAYRRIAANLSRRGGLSRAEASRAALDWVRGIDASPRAVRIARWALWLEMADPTLSPAALLRVVRVGDGLGRWPRSVVAVLGNPPFLGQLKSRTVQSKSARAHLRQRFKGLVGAYTDPAAVFLARSVEGVVHGGRVGLIQPTSTLAARDAQAVRESVEARGWCERFWAFPSGVFDASVSACAMVWTVAPPSASARTSIVTGRRGVASSMERWERGRSWARWLARTIGTPKVGRVKCRGRVEDCAEVSADFRDQYYGLRGLVHELGEGAPAAGMAPLLITAHVEVASHRFGEVEARLLGQRWKRPGVRLADLEQRGLGGFMAARLVPKVVVATQTRVVEACVDARGAFLPVVPLISVTPRVEVDLWRIAAAILSPVTTIHALERCAGAGLSAGAIKLSASAVRAIELPARGVEWEASAMALRDIAQARDADRRAKLRAFGEVSLAAYGLSGVPADRVLSWWLARLG